MGAKLRCEIFPSDLDATADFYVWVLGFTAAGDERLGASDAASGDALAVHFEIANASVAAKRPHLAHAGG